MRGAPRAAAAPVAKASKVSDVEVSPSIVTALKLSTTPSAMRRCSAGAAIGASVNTKASMVAMSGAIMPAPLAMPQMVTVVLPSFAVGGRALGKGVGGHDGPGRGFPGSGSGGGNEAVHHAFEGGGIERFADDAGRGEEHLRRPAAGRFRRDVGGQLGRFAAAAAGEGIGIAGIDDEDAWPGRP